MPDKVKVEVLDEDGLLRVQSFTDNDVFYLVDMKDMVCSCPAYKYGQGSTSYCKHLRVLDRLRRLEEV